MKHELIEKNIGLMIVLTVASCNLLGDALQEALDPRRRRRA